MFRGSRPSQQDRPPQAMTSAADPMFRGSRRISAASSSTMRSSAADPMFRGSRPRIRMTRWFREASAADPMFRGSRHFGCHHRPFLTASAADPMFRGSRLSMPASSRSTPLQRQTRCSGDQDPTNSRSWAKFSLQRQTRCSGDQDLASTALIATSATSAADPMFRGSRLGCYGDVTEQVAFSGRPDVQGIKTAVDCRAQHHGYASAADPMFRGSRPHQRQGDGFWGGLQRQTRCSGDQDCLSRRIILGQHFSGRPDVQGIKTCRELPDAASVWPSAADPMFRGSRHRWRCRYQPVRRTFSGRPDVQGIKTLLLLSSFYLRSSAADPMFRGSRTQSDGSLSRSCRFSGRPDVQGIKTHKPAHRYISSFPSAADPMFRGSRPVGERETFTPIKLQRQTRCSGDQDLSATTAATETGPSAADPMFRGSRHTADVNRPKHQASAADPMFRGSRHGVGFG